MCVGSLVKLQLKFLDFYVFKRGGLFEPLMTVEMRDSPIFDHGLVMRLVFPVLVKQSFQKLLVRPVHHIIGIYRIF